MRLALVLIALALAQPALAECDYQSLEAGPDAEAARVRPVVDKLNVREKGPGSKVIGSLARKQWVTVRGVCGDWLKISHGYGEGWIYNWLTCQPPTEIEIASRRQEISDALDPPAQVWSVSPTCGARYEKRYTKPFRSGGVYYKGGSPYYETIPVTDEEIAEEGMKRLRGGKTE